MAVMQNLIRRAAIGVSRIYKDLFWLPVLPRGWFYRWMFRGENGELRRSGEMVLSDLRDFCFAGPQDTIFDPDPLVMARREGRREVFLRIQYFLNLDEKTVQQLMEIDDGIE